MKSLLIMDCGHSRTKFHSYAQKNVQHQTVENSPFNWPKSLEIRQYSECVLMGTNESMNIRWLSHWRQNSDVAPMVLGKDCRVPIEKRCGSGTGNDRMVHALGAKAQYPNQRVLVVSAGSALVVDLVVSGVLMGGLIGLGWNRYQKAMKSLNANLSTTELDVSYPGLETPEAVSLGWKLSVKTLIDQLLSCEKVDQMLITGGDAGLLKKEYPEAEVNPFLGIDALAQAFGYA